MVKLNLDVVDSDEEFELPKVAPVIERESLRPEKAPIVHGRGKGMMTAGLLADSRRAEAARLEREKLKGENKKKEVEARKKKEADVRRKKRSEEEGEEAQSVPEKRSAQGALGPGDRVDKMARFNTTGLPVALDHLYAGAMVRVGDADGLSSSSHDFMLAGYNFLYDAWYASDQKNRKLNTQNGELVSESNRAKETRCKAEREAVKFKDLHDHSQQMNGDLIAEWDVLISKVGTMTSALAEAKKSEVSQIEGDVAELKSASKDAVARAVREAKTRAKDKLRRSLEYMEERSRAQTEVDRLASLTSQVVGAIRRMDKAVKEGGPVDATKKEKLEARLASYTAEAGAIVLPPFPVDSSADEGVDSRRSVALDISSSDSSDDEVERTEVDGCMSVSGKTPALTLAEIEEASKNEADQVSQLEFELFGGETRGHAEVAGSGELTVADEPLAAKEPVATEAVDVATGKPIALLFPHSNPEEREVTP
ncbi:hypothetical protein AALP_AA2G113000 [Arabis alpina]|uniref:Uncharacterized protein n=1 Tax=Arabis alpina TaxID=50452 RepID=A0A087HGQ2_ARAAL|nr:hypothetical protein AALP_AA2G113000 [Arabis alpina]